MVDYWVPFLGIFVSVALWMLGYRQTFGARKERARAANSELEKVLIRRVVLESYQPTVDDLSRLIGGKAREHRVKRGDLLSEVQLLEAVFTRITESDFMPQDRRNEVLERLSPVYARVEKTTEEAAPLAELTRETKATYARNRLQVVIGFIASVIGTVVVSTMAALGEVGAFPITSMIGAFAGSVGVIATIYLLYRIRESAEEPSARSAMQSARDFEEEVARVLKGLRVPIHIPLEDSGFDFAVVLGRRTALIEVKAYAHRPPLHHIKRVMECLDSAVRAKNADEGIIVTKQPYELPDGLLENTKVRTMTLRDLRNYIAHHSAR